MNFRALGFALLCLLAASNGWAAVAFDAASSSSCSGCTSISFSHTTSGSDRYLAAFATFDLANDLDPSPTTWTYNGVALSSKCTDQVDLQVREQARELINPASGANTFQISFSNNSIDMVAGVVSFTGVHQTTPSGSCASSNGTGTAPSVNVSSATDEIVVDGIGHTDAADTLTAGAGQTERFDTGGAFPIVHGGASTEVGAASVTMSWTISSSRNWAIIGWGVKPASGAAPSGPAGRINLMGVGK